MPTILYIDGWRLFFYSNEKNEPVHIHCTKAECDAKYWLDSTTFDIKPAYEYNLSPADRRAIREIVFKHFEYLVEEWAKVHGDGHE